MRLHPGFALLVLSASLLAPAAEWREIDWEGQRIRYQIIDGYAVWNGDILLGPAAEFEAEVRTKSGARYSSVLRNQARRWPNGVVPYVIDTGFPNPQRIHDAVREWNERTPIRLVPRSGEANYIIFREPATNVCNSFVGMIGGGQVINLGSGCQVGQTIHEIGHAVGLYHTQSREDRDLYVSVDLDSIEAQSRSQYARTGAAADDVGAYPFESVMHYSTRGFALPGRVAMTTIPAGIPLGQRSNLAATDVDTVIRVYGGQPAQTVITSNPVGLRITVDGQTYTTPAAFDWPWGSRHNIAIADQASGNTQILFGRWSDFGPASHDITATPERTVFTAQMRLLYPVGFTASPANAGGIVVDPAPQNGRWADGSLLRLTAQPRSGFSFLNWNTSTLGSINPLPAPLTGATQQYTATFAAGPITTITTAPPGQRIQVDGVAYTSPRRFAWAPGTRHEIAPESTSPTGTAGLQGLRWIGWSHGGPQRQTITAGDASATYTGEYETNYTLATVASPGNGGRIVIEPAPINGALPAGTTATVTAIPAAGFGFAGWSGALTGTAERQTITVDGPVELTARFLRPATLTTAGITSNATFLSGPVVPGQIVSVFGLNIGPDAPSGVQLTAQRRVATSSGGVRLLFDGTPAPILYASAQQVVAVVPFNVAGKPSVRVQLDYAGSLTNLLPVTVAAAAPGFFTANSSGQGGGAFLNEDGSLNTPGNGAASGSVIVLYATGLGSMTPTPADGQLAEAPYARPVAPVKVWIADREAEILYCGAAPDLVAGLVQINVRIPAGVAPGIVPVLLEAGGIRSPRSVSLAVR